MIRLPAFNIGFRSIDEARSQLSRSLDIIVGAFQVAVTLIDIANAVRSGALSIDRLQVGHGQLLLDQNSFLYLKNFNPGTSHVAPVGGGIFFVDSGALKYLGSAGTVTTVAPA